MENRQTMPVHLFDEEYFIWLCELVDAEDPDQGYFGLMHLLHDIRFDSSTAKLIPNDDNRIGDAIEMKTYYYIEYRGWNPADMIDNAYFCNVSVLEVLIALAYRISDTFGRYDGIYWFWEMMRNLGLETCTDKIFYDHGGKERAYRIVRNFMIRKYDRDGFGGLFPVTKTSEDQRKTELWFQANHYFVENYM